MESHVDSSGSSDAEDYNTPLSEEESSSRSAEPILKSEKEVSFSIPKEPVVVIDKLLAKGDFKEIFNFLEEFCSFKPSARSRCDKFASETSEIFTYMVSNYIKGSYGLSELVKKFELLSMAIDENIHKYPSFESPIMNGSGHKFGKAKKRKVSLTPSGFNTIGKNDPKTFYSVKIMNKKVDQTHMKENQKNFDKYLGDVINSDYMVPGDVNSFDGYMGNTGKGFLVLNKKLDRKDSGVDLAGSP